MKNLFLVFSFVFVELLPVSAQDNSTCDSIIFYKLINRFIEYQDRHVTAKYLISTNVNHYPDVLVQQNIISRQCAGIKMLDSNYVRLRKGKLQDSKTYVHDENIVMFTLFVPVYNEELNKYVLQVKSTGSFGWGGATVLYYFKKRGKTFKLTRRIVIGVS